MDTQDIANTNPERLIYIDDLTGLFNRRYLYYQLPKEIEKIKQTKENLWVFMLDIDNFKLINDSYGHLAGDEIIKAIANLLRENTKSADKKIRYAGDEFTVILSNSELKNAVSVAQRLITKVSAQPFRESHSGKDINMSISLGIAGFPQDAQDAKELINLADKALYISKQRGKNCFSMASEITTELFWKTDILERFPCSNVYGRENEFSKLKEALSNTGKSDVRLALISGALGVGKTRILNEFEKIVSSGAAAIALSSKCEEKHLTQPYYSIGQALYKYIAKLDKLPPEILNGISEQELAALFAFMPVLQDICVDFSLNSAHDEEQKYLNEALIKFLCNISKIKPLCMFFDDLHYVDSHSMDIILRLVMDQNNEYPILIVGTFCLDTLTNPEMAVSSFNRAMKKEDLSIRLAAIELKNLTTKATFEMISNILTDIPLSQPFFELLYKITKGNALFIEVLLKYIIEKEFIFYKDGRWIQKELSESELPLSIEETIKARIEELSPEIKEMIAKAAVIGEDFQIDMLQKIESEDRGYILDLMEAVKKIGLIYERGSSGRDEYSFVTGEIRKVLFTAIGDSRTKYLHSRVGEIKEKMYGDKISGIAGELYYNFKKAQDFIRAEQYANIVKSGRNTFYDQTMQYAQSLLSSALEEKEAVSLSKEALKLLPEIIRYIYISSMNFILYPNKSQMRAQPLQELYKRIGRILEEMEILNIGCIENTIFVNNKKIGKTANSFFSNAFISLLSNLNIERIIFKKGIKEGELGLFFEIVNSANKSDKGLTEQLKNSAVTNIQISEITYDSLRSKHKEKEKLEEIMLIDYLLGKMPFLDDKKGDLVSAVTTHAEEISQALEKLSEQESQKSGKPKENIKAEIMANSIQKIGSQFVKENKEDWTKYKENLAKTILSMESNLRSKILTTEAEPQQTDKDKKEPKLDILKEIRSEMPEDIVVDVLTKQYLQKDIDFEKMKSLVGKFLSESSKKERLETVLRGKFQAIGATDSECDYIFTNKWEVFSLDEKVDKILTMPSDVLLKMLSMIRLPAIIGELLSLGHNAKLEATLERIFKLVEDTAVHNQTLIGYLKEILGIFIQSSQYKFLPKFIHRFLKVVRFNKEKNLPLFFKVISPYVVKIIDIFLSHKVYNLTKETISIYLAEKNDAIDHSAMFKEITCKMVETLVKLIDIDMDNSELSDIVVLLKGYAEEPLIEAALFAQVIEESKYFEAYVKRFTIAHILRQLSKEKIIDVLKQKFESREFYIIRNLIELISAIGEEDVIKTLKLPLKHKDSNVRRKVIFSLSKIKIKETATLLGEALNDTDESIRKNALNILKNRHDEFSLEILKNCLNNKDLPEDIRNNIKH